MAKYVYAFGGNKAEGKAAMKNLLGGKGSNLAEMTNLGVPVPAGLTLTTDVCIYYTNNKKKYPSQLKAEVARQLAVVEKKMGNKFGDKQNPLLLSVRSGARVSMPGMMDTVLNIGLNDTTTQGLIKQTGNERFAYDAYRRFINMYGDVVMGVPHEKFEQQMDKIKTARRVKLDTDLSAVDLKKLSAEYKNLVSRETGVKFPDEPMAQLWGAITAVFGSWDIDRAVTYRKLNKIPDHWGTAANVQAMVFGNMGNDSGTGVAFTRDPSTGEKLFYGEYLLNAQGEDVVAGIRTPQPINKAGKQKGSKAKSMEEEMPTNYRQLVAIYKRLEKHYRDMQDIEFTVEKGKLWMLQTRTGKRTAASAVRCAVEMFREGLIDKKTAVLRVEPDQLDQLLHPMIDPKAKVKDIAKGLPASPGAASGQVVFSAQDAEEWAAAGKKVILVRNETSPEDIGGMNAAQAILTAKGGMTSHAAVVARGMGKCCVAGCGALAINYAKKQLVVGSNMIKEGDVITLEGSSGKVFLGPVPTVTAKLDKNFKTLMSWADSFRKLGVRTNADTPGDSKVARDFGAEGIGLCRTEHMFFEEDRLPWMRKMIMAKDEAERRSALKKLLPIQRRDFVGIFKAMAGLPVTIRLLDPPLHEFVPHEDAEMKRLSREIGIPLATLKAKGESLKELNPMLGHRGCRLSVTYPEILEMQARAIIEAACEVKKAGIRVLPEIMIPLVSHVNEYTYCHERVVQTAKKVMAERKVKVQYMVGTMIELPRAALQAGRIAEGGAEFFSFGTNDLTQTAFGFSRDDAGVFLPEYVDRKILPSDPFQQLDQEGVGELVKIGVERGRKVNKKLKIGICGEHGGDPTSVYFCHRVGLNYVSCSPYRVPIARLAAAHAVLVNKK